MKAPLTSMAEDVLAFLNDNGRTSLAPCQRTLFEMVKATGLNRSAVLVALEELDSFGLAEAVEWKATAK